MPHHGIFCGTIEAIFIAAHTMPRFFSETSLAEITPGQNICLPDAVFHHAVRVRRLKSGDGCTLFDGNGNVWRVTLTGIDKRQAFARAENRLPPTPPPSFPITLALAVTAADRMDWALQKGTELGAAAFLPFYSEHSNARLSDARQQRRSEHWQAVIVGACEQCDRNQLPRLSLPVTFDAILKTAASEATALRFFLDTCPQQTLTAALYSAQKRSPPPVQAFLMVGPEGGFTPDETRAATAAGWQAVRLGPRVLRAETAAVTAIALVQAFFGDLA
ncbi:MAG: 16S rRNA (uracil(1498)-N(3))-methyltransferase [Burkholderiales bacterium]|jgi:16S rRNA (uracil1498-N3)-methyltransferase|nr:16S rRNA (uracil(1498)-N(3))-methyltransferase [Burkholderiales bacterium]